jgi:hypothetical protein
VRKSTFLPNRGHTSDQQKRPSSNPGSVARETGHAIFDPENVIFNASYVFFGFIGLLALLVPITTFESGLRGEVDIFAQSGTP